nr:DUF551 domain-containing protein [Klebsiella pneumoniae]EKV8924198.1 DUF551 domain-containing protein [Klebsiella pneumoniae]ELA0718797.1 DUF551 domain-containing protein [Klebsiella pneumoniae]
MAKQGVESVPIWSVITDLERNIAPLYRHAQPVPVVPYDFDFDRFNDVVWLECVASNPHMHSPTTSIIARVALELNKRILAGNSPVIPEGYVMVPKEPTEQMYDAGDRQMATKQVWDAMLAAAPQQHNAPQNIPEIIPGWIPVSEGMPKRGDYLVTDGRDFDVQTFDGEQFIPGFVWDDGITHWMPLPAAPQEVK